MHTTYIHILYTYYYTILKSDLSLCKASKGQVSLLGFHGCLQVVGFFSLVFKKSYIFSAAYGSVENLVSLDQDTHFGWQCYEPFYPQIIVTCRPIIAFNHITPQYIGNSWWNYKTCDMVLFLELLKSGSLILVLQGSLQFLKLFLILRWLKSVQN